MGSLYGFEIKSELPLRRLNSAPGTRGEMTIEACREPLAAPGDKPVSRLVDEDGRCWYACHELGGGDSLLELPPSGAFLLRPEAGRIVVDSRDDDAELLEHRIESSALCTLLALRGDLVLHASALEVDRRALIVCGPSRRGKSTLARVLGESGCRVLAEDGVAIELGEGKATTFPGARGVRLRHRRADGRHRTDLLADPGPGEPQPCPVGTVVLLDERGERLEIAPLQPSQALALLTPHLVHSGGRTSIGAAFSRLATLLGSVAAIRVTLPDDLAALPAAAEELLDSAAAQG